MAPKFTIMEYIETLQPLENLYLVQEYPTPQAYFLLTGKTAPEFDINKDIKLWEHTPENVGPRQVLYDVIAQNEDNGVWIYDDSGKYVTEFILMLKSDAAKVNIPPSDFNYTAHPNLRKVNRPLKEGVSSKYDLIKSPDGFSIVARDKELYAKYLSEKNAPAGSNPAFEASVLAYLAAISKKLGI